MHAYRSGALPRPGLPRQFRDCASCRGASALTFVRQSRCALIFGLDFLLVGGGALPIADRGIGPFPRGRWLNNGASQPTLLGPIRICIVRRSTPSPSITHDRTLRWFTAPVTSGQRLVQSLPLRVMSRMPTESRRSHQPASRSGIDKDRPDYTVYIWAARLTGLSSRTLRRRP